MTNGNPCSWQINAAAGNPGSSHSSVKGELRPHASRKTLIGIIVAPQGSIRNNVRRSNDRFDRVARLERIGRLSGRLS